MVIVSFVTQFVEFADVDAFHTYTNTLTHFTYKICLFAILPIFYFVTRARSI